MANKLTPFVAVLAVGLAGASQLALAHSNTARMDHRAMAENANTRATTESADTIQPDQLRASKVIGSAVYDRSHAKIGSVDDIVLDRDGRVAAVAISVGGFLGAGAKDVAVRLSDIRTDNNRLTLDVTKERLQQMASYHLTNRTTGAGTSESPVHGGQLGSGSSR